MIYVNRKPVVFLRTEKKYCDFSLIQKILVPWILLVTIYLYDEYDDDVEKKYL